jgi:GTP pyrophosphokinase
MKFEELKEKIREKELKVDIDLITLAYEYASKAHGNQLRKSGELYINHPLATAYKLADMGMDEAMIIAGLLHDVPEDTDKTINDIKKEFGKEVAQLVAGITKLGQIKYRGMERYIENLRHMFIAMADDIRVIIIKFADRIHNLETLSVLPAIKQKRIALESLEIYAPIANRLGMGEIKGTLEDLSFPYVYPEEYEWIENNFIIQRRQKKKVIDIYIKELEQIIKKGGVPYLSIHGRAKHIYSLYKKLLRHSRDISKIYDLVAVRIIVPDVTKCYECLGIIHQHSKPLKGRIKDYIAQPKPNGYQSLHTTIFSFSGDIIEIQIRTQDMHLEAEYGIAAHWAYKENFKPQKIQNKLAWVSELSQIVKTSFKEGSQQKLETLKLDVFQDRIFVFTPKGDVIELPEDATPIDFAYHIHTDLGHYCSSVKINDEIATMNTKLKSGDVISITIDPRKKGPSVDWLQFVKTTKARKHIKTFLRNKKKGFIHRLLNRDSALEIDF